jgi:hypothetical protein
VDDNRNAWRRWLSALGWTLITAAGIGWPIYIWQKIASGHGRDTYFTGFGVEFNYIGAGILFALLPLVLLAGALLNRWLGREERDFMRRYGRGKDSQ